MNVAVETKILDLLTGEATEATTRETFRNLYREGKLDDRIVEVDVPSSSAGRITLDPSGGMQSVQVPRPRPSAGLRVWKDRRDELFHSRREVLGVGGEWRSSRGPPLPPCGGADCLPLSAPPRFLRAPPWPA